MDVSDGEEEKEEERGDGCHSCRRRFEFCLNTTTSKSFSTEITASLEASTAFVKNHLPTRNEQLTRLISEGAFNVLFVGGGATCRHGEAGEQRHRAPPTTTDDWSLVPLFLSVGNGRRHFGDSCPRLLYSRRTS